MRNLLLLLCLLALPSWGATLSTTTCTSTDRTGCLVMGLSVYNPLPSTVGVQLSGTWTGTVVFEGSVNGTAYVPVTARPNSGGSWASEATSVGVWAADVAGLLYFRVRASALSSGTVTVHANPSTARPVVDVVRAVGSTFGEVAVSGTVNAALTSETLAVIGPHACTHGGVRRLSIGTTPEAVPNDLPDGGGGAMSERTMVLLQNASSNQDVACRFDPGDGGVPDCAVPGYGLTLFPRARYVELPARDTDRLLCVACSGSNIPLEYLERSCSR